MKFYLVDKYDNINSTAVLDSGVGLSGARTYFLGIKKIDEKLPDEKRKYTTFGVPENYSANFSPFYGILGG